MSEPINTGGPAFPAPEAGDRHFGDASVYSGMPIRDYFAAVAMAFHGAALTNWACSSEQEWNAEVARMAYATADAMIKAREGGTA